MTTLSDLLLLPIESMYNAQVKSNQISTTITIENLKRESITADVGDDTTIEIPRLLLNPCTNFQITRGQVGMTVVLKPNGEVGVARDDQTPSAMKLQMTIGSCDDADQAIRSRLSDRYRNINVHRGKNADQA